MAVPLHGLAKGFLILSVPTVGYFSDLARYQWTLLSMLLALLLVGLLLGVLVNTEVLPVVPASLVAAASKIERGDYSARAPEFLGALGTVAGALNKAAAAAETGAVRLTTGDPFSAGATAQKFNLPSGQGPAPAPAEPPEAPPARPAAEAPILGTMAPASGDELEGGVRGPGGSAFSMSALEGARPPAPVAPPAPPPAAAPPPSTATSLFQAATPAADGEEGDEEHWRSVHAEFLRVRVQCGEVVDGLGYERFRPKLEKNKLQLIEKHGCRTVRFSVYVKDGKAALRATPVR
jgi:hypothetical protein